MKKTINKELNQLIKKVWRCEDLTNCEKAIIDTTLNERFNQK